MKFIHAYVDFFMPGIEKNGFINKDTGFKLPNVFSVPNEKRFNEYAYKGSPFYNFIKEGNFPFYVDRVAGGITFLDYQFDKKTVGAYKELLGDWFLGFQMHESASNLRNADWPRMIRKMGSKGPYDLEEFRQKMRSTYAVAPDGRTQYEINHDTPEYYASRTYSEHFSDYFDDVRDMFRRRIEATYDNVLAADSSFLMSKMQADMGIRNFMPEIGGCCRLTRMVVAIARGTARAARAENGVPITKLGGRCLTAGSACPATQLTSETSGICRKRRTRITSPPTARTAAVPATCKSVCTSTPS